MYSLRMSFWVVPAIRSQGTPWLLVLTLAVTLYLTVIELRTMDVHYTRWVWWLLLVFMTHFVGYLFLRAYVLYRRRQFA